MNLLRRYFTRPFAFAMLLCLSLQLAAPMSAFALTGGPSQSEFQSFEPVGTSDLVDLFTGDFNYNLPLLDVGGYPVNLHYHSGITMDQEPSWVGLGWNINPGVINRSMRGLPDDFKGDPVKIEQNIRKNQTVGVRFNDNIQYFGGPISLSAGTSFGIFHNNYKGLGIELGLTAGISAQLSKSIGTEKTYAIAGKTDGIGGQQTVGGSIGQEVGINFNTQQGVSLNSSLSLGLSAMGGAGLGVTVGNATNSRQGVTSNGFSVSFKSHLVKLGYSSFDKVVPAYVPQIQQQFLNSAYNFHGTFGGEVYGAHLSSMITGYGMGATILEPKREIPGFGYLYSHLHENDDCMMDFNREKDGIFTMGLTNLGVSQFSPDLFGVTGQGVGGAYRVFRNDVGHVFDNHAQDLSNSFDAGAEVGLGDFVHAGLDINASYAASSSGDISGSHAIAERFPYYKESNFENKPAFEPTYFKMLGENAARKDETFYQNIGGNEPVRFKLNGSENFTSELENTAFDGSVSPVSTSSTPQYRIADNERETRTQLLANLNADEASRFGLNPNLFNYSLNLSSAPAVTRTELPRVNDTHKPHHLSELTVTQTDGTRHVYGLPAYNTTQQDVSFRLDGYEPYGGDNLNGRRASGLASYDAGEDNSLQNDNRLDNYFQKQYTPSYAHSYLLTAVLSADYVDLTGNGLSDDDLGTWVRFDYSKTPDNYRWRVPYQENKAAFQDGVRGNRGDDMGNYSYGEKEIWYLHSITTKTHTARFYLIPRKDGYGVKGENGGRDEGTTQKLYALDKITLFAKPQRQSNDILESDLKPLQTVHFDYNYELCRNLPSNEENGSSDLEKGGKLTLKKVWITEGKSSRGSLTPYKFSYGKFRPSSGSPVDVNPDYDQQKNDRWGRYKAGNHGSATLPNALLQDEFPYTLQDDRAEADQWAHAWHLTDIQMPSGGNMRIYYEADDYAYVQDKPAMEMTKVVGTADQSQIDAYIASSDNTLSYSNYLFSGSNNHEYLILNLEEDIPLPPGSAGLEANKIAMFKKLYLKDITEKGHLYFRGKVQLAPHNALGVQISGNSAENLWEYVSAYLKLDATTPVRVLTDRIVALKIQTVQMDGEDNDQIHPIAKAAWQFTRKNRPGYIYMQDDDPNFGENLQNVITGMIAWAVDIASMIKGLNQQLRDMDFGRKIWINGSATNTFTAKLTSLDDEDLNPDRSHAWVRLCEPTQRKIGGGVRIKRIETSDNWKTMTEDHNNRVEEDGVYGQQYDYSIAEDSDKGVYYSGLSRSISSGVAAYEPILGGDENPWRTPVNYIVNNVHFPDDELFFEAPFGESAFPAPTVGYRKVVVKSIHAQNEPSRTGTGRTEYEFYTARDFPVIVKETLIDKKRDRTPFNLNDPFSVVESFETVAATQGYTIELNDMHGKLKSSSSFAEYRLGAEDEVIANVIPLTQTEYTYRNNGNKQLNTLVPVIDREGTITNNQEIGRDVDFTIDTREHKTVAESANLGLNVDVFFAKPGPFPIVVPMIWPGETRDETRYRSVVTTKVIQRYGIVESVKTSEDGASIEARNLAWDAETGQVLLSSSTTEYGDTLYNFTYPAYWAYDGMGPAYRNYGMKFKAVEVLAGEIEALPKNAIVLPHLVPGDEVITSQGKYWVHQDDSKFYLMDRNGILFDKPTVDFQIVRSGRRNLQSASMGAVASLTDPRDGGKVEWVNQNPAITGHDLNVINASAVEFANHWPVYCCGLAYNKLIANSYSSVLSEGSGVDETELGNKYADETLLNFLNQTLETPTTTITQRMFDIKSNYGLNQWFGFTSSTPNLTGDAKYFASILAEGQFPNTDNAKLLFYLPTLEDPLTYKASISVRKGNNPYTIHPAVLILTPVSNEYYIANVKSPGTACANVLEPNVLSNTTTFPSTFFNQITDFVEIKPLIEREGDVSDFLLTAQLTDAGGCRYVRLKGHISGYKLYKISKESLEEPKFCGAEPGSFVNPYVKGVLGSWRVRRSLSFYDRMRTPLDYKTSSSSRTAINQQPNKPARESGFIPEFNFKPYWYFNGTSGVWETSSNTKWVAHEHITKYTPWDHPVEKLDKLGRKVTTLLGYNFSLPTASAVNAGYSDVASDGFEDYSVNTPTDIACYNPPHFDFIPFADGVELAPKIAHTGRFSLMVPPNGKQDATRDVKPKSVCEAETTATGRYQLTEDDCIGIFEPTNNDKYIVSAWVRQTMKPDPSYRQTGMQVILSNSTGELTYYSFEPTGPIIDGWQRIYGEFKIESTHKTITLRLVNGQSGVDEYAYFDDVRVHPALSAMQSMVYDPTTRLKMADLDDNNFATFYEYDAELRMVRVKRETEKGIKTIQETRLHQTNINNVAP